MRSGVLRRLTDKIICWFLGTFSSSYYFRSRKKLRGVRPFERAEIIPSEPALDHASEGKLFK